MRATSVGTASARAPARAASAPTVFAAASSAAPGRSARQRLRPRAAKLLAAARPMPLAAPVMTAVRPAAMAGWSAGMAELLAANHAGRRGNEIVICDVLDNIRAVPLQQFSDIV